MFSLTRKLPERNNLFSSWKICRENVHKSSKCVLYLVIIYPKSSSLNLQKGPLIHKENPHPPPQDPAKSSQYNHMTHNLKWYINEKSTVGRFWIKMLEMFILNLATCVVCTGYSSTAYLNLVSNFGSGIIDRSSQFSDVLQADLIIQLCEISFLLCEKLTNKKRINTKYLWRDLFSRWIICNSWDIDQPWKD